MSLDPNTLKSGDRVRFSNRITKDVTWAGQFGDIVRFSDGSEMRYKDRLWELVELVEGYLPNTLQTATLTRENHYKFRTDIHNMTPGAFFRTLQSDINHLRIAGITENSR